MATRNATGPILGGAQHSNILRGPRPDPVSLIMWEQVERGIIDPSEARALLTSIDAAAARATRHRSASRRVGPA